jgi:threonine/homoserine/homoserine lactone efflux protein
MLTRQTRRRSGVGTVFVALVLIVLGSYYLLRNTFGVALPELEDDAVVAAIAVVGGVLLLYVAWRERSRTSQPEQPPRP